MNINWRILNTENFGFPKRNLVLLNNICTPILQMVVSDNTLCPKLYVQTTSSNFVKQPIRNKKLFYYKFCIPRTTSGDCV
jgi:hypothetical protein